MIHLRHRWYPIQTQQAKEGPYDQPKEHWPPVTLVLYLCMAPRCAKHKVEKLDGSWTLDELLGDRSEGRQ